MRVTLKSTKDRKKTQGEKTDCFFSEEKVHFSATMTNSRNEITTLSTERGKKSWIEFFNQLSLIHDWGLNNDFIKKFGHNRPSLEELLKDVLD